METEYLIGFGIGAFLGVIVVQILLQVSVNRLCRERRAQK